MNIPKHAFVAAIVALGASIVACNDPLDFDEPSTQTVEQAIASADSVGTNDSKFFPIGIYYAGSSGQGASPQDASDATQYYRETLLHLKSIGINVIINSNSYVGSAAYNLLEAATELGGIYVIQSNIAFNGVTDCWPVNTASLDLIASDSVTNLSKYPALVGYQVQDEPLAIRMPSIRSALKAIAMYEQASPSSSTLHTSFGAVATCKGAGCLGYNYLCDKQFAPACVMPSEAYCQFYTPGFFATAQSVTNYSSSTGDEYPLRPRICAVPCDSGPIGDSWCQSNGFGSACVYAGALPGETGWCDGSPRCDSNADCSGGIGAATCSHTIGDASLLEAWGDGLTLLYQQTPRDVPLNQAIQAHHWDGRYGLRDPTATEVRYQTYAALARGARGIFYFMYQRLFDDPPLPPTGRINNDGYVGRGGIADLDFNLNEGGAEIRKLASELRILGPWLAEATRDDQSGGTPIATVSGLATQSDLVPFRTVFNEELLMLVNQRTADTSSSGYTITLNASNPFVQQLFAKGSIAVRDLRAGTVIATCASACSFADTVAPGDGKLYQLQSQLSADIRVPKGSYNNPVNAGKSIVVSLKIKNNGTTTWTTTSHHIGVHVRSPSGTYTAQATGVAGSNFTANVPAGGTTNVVLTIPTGTGTSVNANGTENGTYQLTLDVYQDGTPNKWFLNDVSFSVMLNPAPLLVDTFDALPYNAPAGSFYRWKPGTNTGVPSQVRSECNCPASGSCACTSALAVNGSTARTPTDPIATISSWGSSWSTYILEFDVMIDKEASDPTAYAGWVARAPNATNGYWFRLSANTVPSGPASSILRYTLVNDQPTSHGSDSTGLTITKGTWYHIKQDFSGSTVTTSIRPRDGGALTQLTPPWTCSGGGCPSAGAVGFRQLEDFATAWWMDPPATPLTERAHFDNVNVYSSAVDNAAPPAPTQLTVEPIGNTLVLKWPVDTSASGAKVSHYAVYRGTTAGFAINPSSLYAQPAGNEFVDTSVNRGTPYYYAVKAISHADVASTTSAYATCPSGLLNCNVVPAFPTASGLTADVTGEGMKSVVLAWSGSASKYKIHRGSVATEQNHIATATYTAYRDTISNSFVSDSQLGLGGFRTYSYTVVPVSTSGELGTGVTINNVSTTGSKQFSDGFDSTSNPKWTTLTGGWSINTATSSYLSWNSCTPNCVVPSISNRSGGSETISRDLVAEFTVQITNQGNSSTNWAGMTIHKSIMNGSILNTPGITGILVYYRANGYIEVLEPANGVIAAVDTHLSPVSASRRVRIESNGQYLRVLVDGTLFVDIHHGAGSVGYTDLITYGVSARYRDVAIFFKDSFNRSATFDGSTNWSYVGSGMTGLGLNQSQLTLAPPADTTLWLMSPKNVRVGEFNADFTMRVDPLVGGSTSSWGAFSFRKTTGTASPFTSGYTVYLRANGELQLLAGARGVVGQTVQLSCAALDQMTEPTLPSWFAPFPSLPSWFVTSSSPSTCAHRIRLVVINVGGKPRILVWVDGGYTQIIDWTDPSPDASQPSIGYTSLASYGAKTRFESLEIY